MEVNVTTERVGMSIRTAIDTYCRHSSREILSRHFGYPIHNPRSRPTNGDLIFMLATALREKYQIQPEDGEFEWPQITEEEKVEYTNDNGYTLVHLDEENFETIDDDDFNF